MLLVSHICPTPETGVSGRRGLECPPCTNRSVRPSQTFRLIQTGHSGRAGLSTPSGFILISGVGEKLTVQSSFFSPILSSSQTTALDQELHREGSSTPDLAVAASHFPSLVVGIISPQV